MAPPALRARPRTEPARTPAAAPAGRDLLLERLSGREHDVLIVGGGINGAISALALAAHGLRVALVEKDDFAAGVSQESSNLIWGGFKYLQTFDVRLVAGLCRSRNRLARAYPNRIREVRFLAALGATSPYSPTFAATGAYIYWALGRFATRPPRRISRRSVGRREPIIAAAGLRGGLEYSDHLLTEGDSRFVVQLLLDAADRGAVTVSRIRLDGAERAGGHWRATVTDRLSGTSLAVRARVLVNAAGPRAPAVARASGGGLGSELVLSKGVHLVVPQVTDSGRVLAFFDDDQRLFYVIPMGHRSIIGSTDTRVAGPEVNVTAADRDFLLDQANARLQLSSPLGASDVIAERCGVRPLIADGDATTHRSWTELSRRHAIEVDATVGVISILGGKLSDCLNVGEEVVEAAGRCGLPAAKPSGPWFGEPPAQARERFLLAARAMEIDPATAATWWRRHGEAAFDVAGLVCSSPDQGAPLSDMVDYSEAEVRLMAGREHVVTLEDFLRRRTSLAMVESSERLATDPGVARVAEILTEVAGTGTKGLDDPANGRPDAAPAKRTGAGER